MPKWYPQKIIPPILPTYGTTMSNNNVTMANQNDNCVWLIGYLPPYLRGKIIVRISITASGSATKSVTLTTQSAAKGGTWATVTTLAQSISMTTNLDYIDYEVYFDQSKPLHRFFITADVALTVTLSVYSAVMITIPNDESF